MADVGPRPLDAPQRLVSAGLPNTGQADGRPTAGAEDSVASGAQVVKPEVWRPGALLVLPAPHPLPVAAAGGPLEWPRSTPDTASQPQLSPAGGGRERRCRPRPDLPRGGPGENLRFLHPSG